MSTLLLLVLALLPRLEATGDQFLVTFSPGAAPLGNSLPSR